MDREYFCAAVGLGKVRYRVRSGARIRLIAQSCRKRAVTTMSSKETFCKDDCFSNDVKNEYQLLHGTEFSYLLE